MTIPSLGDFSNTVGVAFLGVGQIVTWVMISRRDQRNATKSAADHAVSDAEDAAAIRDLAKANTRIAAALEKLEDWARTHELQDEVRWSAHAEAMKSQAETNTRLAAINENIARQITNLALGLAPVEGQALGANARRRATS